MDGQSTSQLADVTISVVDKYRLTNTVGDQDRLDGMRRRDSYREEQSLYR